MSTNAAADAGRRKVVVAPHIGNPGGVSFLRVLPVWIISAVLRGGLILLFSQINIADSKADNPGELKPIKKEQNDVEEPQELDLTQIDLGTNSGEDTNYDLDRRDPEISVPGPVNPDQPPGLPGGTADAAMTSTPPPPGPGGGLGLAREGPEPGVAPNWGGLVGGMGGIYNAGGIGGRSGATREKLLQAGGGNAESESAVARGLLWLARHQAADGHWSLNDFNRFGREKPIPGGRTFVCNCSGMTARRNDVAATAFGLLPFLGAGHTHKGAAREDSKIDYSKTVGAGLRWLINKQGKDGYYGGDMYSQGLATIAMCEAYGLTSDTMLKASAQRALDYIARAQDPTGGGWRYSPREPGDLSVTGWQLMAIKSGQMSGLSVPKATLRRAEKFLDDVESSNKGGYKYMAGQNETVTMTAVGLLCRQYSGLNPRNPGLLLGVERLKKSPPNINGNLYYLYYATQVMHHMGGENWQFWNEGNPRGTGIRDTLIRKQYKDTTGKFAHMSGSWDPASAGVGDGGRMMATSLSILSLEVYYRHLPLYRRELGVNKAAK